MYRPARTDRIGPVFSAPDTTPTLVGMRAGANLGPEYRDAFDSVYPDLAEQFHVQLYPFLLEGVALEPDLNQADGIHPNAAGVARIVEEIGPFVLVLARSIRSGEEP